LYQYGYKNNYIRVAESAELSAYNSANLIKYGETNLQTDFDVNQDKELFTDPFGAAMDSVSPYYLGWCQANIPLVNLSDSTEYEYTSVSNDGGFVKFDGTFPDTIIGGTLIRVIDDAGYYTGYHRVTTYTTISVTVETDFIASSTGTFLTQSTQFNDAGSRLLVNIPNYSISNIGRVTSYYIDGSNYTEAPYAYFSKPTTGYNVDKLKASLSYGSLNLNGYNDIPLDKLYFSRIKNMLGNPIIRAQLNLPESVVRNFNSDKIIHITCKDFDLDLWVDQIYQYDEGSKTVQVDFLIS
jgi:hypothetical protein